MAMRRGSAVLVLLLAAGLPAAASAQACGLAHGAGISAAGGWVHYDLGAGVDGYSAGADLALAAGPVALRAGYRRMLLEGDTDPDVLRLALALPVVRVLGVDVCATGYAGGARFAIADDSGLALAGGLGVTLAVSRPVGPAGIAPFVTVRGLGAQTTGTVLGFDLDASGLSLGVEGGLAAVLGPFDLRLTGSLDGFDSGLGTTPYPARSVELAVGLGF